MFDRKITNRLLLLQLLFEKKNHKYGAMGIHSVIFHIQSLMRNRGITRSFNYEFIRWSYGPYSKELSNDIEVLKSKDLLDKEGNLTSVAYQYLNKNETFINERFREILPFTDILLDIDTLDLQSLLLYVYQQYNIRESKMGKRISSKLYCLDR